LPLNDGAQFVRVPPDRRQRKESDQSEQRAQNQKQSKDDQQAFHAAPLLSLKAANRRQKRDT
jgi:hypothetical protein